MPRDRIQEVTAGMALDARLGRRTGTSFVPARIGRVLPLSELTTCSSGQIPGRCPPPARVVAVQEATAPGLGVENATVLLLSAVRLGLI